MRTTRSMMVNNSIYFISKQAEKLADAQTITSTGKQINKPSDDPLSAGQLLSDRTSLSQYGQYQSNISQAMTWIEASETTLDSASTFLQEAKKILSSLSSGTTSTTEDYTEELKTINDQILSLANARYGSGYMYGGDINTQTAPFSNEVAVSSGVAENILFEMANDASSVTIEVTDTSGNIVRTLNVSGGIAGTNSIVWDGLDNNGNSLSDGQYDFTVSAINAGGKAVAVFPSYRGSEEGKTVMTAEDNITVLNNNGEAIFSDALSVLSQAIAAIENGEDTNALSDIKDVLQTSIDSITSIRTTQASVNSQLERKLSRFETLTVNLNSRIYETETGSTTEAAIKLQTQETAYEEAIAAAKEILNMPKLSDYL